MTITIPTNATAPAAPPRIAARVLDIWSGSYFSNTTEEMCGGVDYETSNLTWIGEKRSHKRKGHEASYKGSGGLMTTKDDYH